MPSTFQRMHRSGLIVSLAGLLCFGCSKPQSQPRALGKSAIEPLPVPSPGTQPIVNTPTQEPPAEQEAAQAEREQAIEAYFTKKARDMLSSGSQCPPGKKLVEVLSEVYGDLDGDGKDEVVVTAMSCLAGQIPDLNAVLRFGSYGKITEMPFAKKDPNRLFLHMNPQADARGTPSTAIERGRLVDSQGIYKPGDANCCPTGGTRRSYYRWNGHELLLEDVVDSTDPFN